MTVGRRFGITGHQNLPPPVRILIGKHVRDLLATETKPIGYSALAAGADQLFAEEILNRNGRLIAVLPSLDYEETFKSSAELQDYRLLLDQASEVVRMSFERASEEAYWAAGKEVVRRCDVLIAVWDGKDAAGLGGTGDVVQFARFLHKDICAIWPAGARRT